VFSAKAVDSKYAVKFQQKSWRNRTVTFAPFSLCWHLRVLRKLVG